MAAAAEPDTAGTPDPPAPPALDYLFTVTVMVEAPLMLAGTPTGTQGLIQVVGGRFDGPRMRGRVVPPGGDWFTVRASGAMVVDARLTFVTDDGTTIAMSYEGIAVQVDGATAIRVAPRFSAPEGSYGWLNDIQGVAVGRVGDGQVIYDVYALGRAG